MRELIRRMSKENPLWGAPRIHGELPPSLRWRPSLPHHILHGKPEQLSSTVAHNQKRKQALEGHGRTHVGGGADLFGARQRRCVWTRHLRRVLALCSQYYNDTRTPLSLAKDAPFGRAIQWLRDHRRHTNPFRPASPLRANIIFERDRQDRDKRRATRPA